MKLRHCSFGLDPFEIIEDDSWIRQTRMKHIYKLDMGVVEERRGLARSKTWTGIFRAKRSGSVSRIPTLFNTALNISLSRCD